MGGARFLTEEQKEWRRAYGKYGPSGLISMGAGQSGPNSLKQTSKDTRYFTGQLLAEYKKTIGVHEISALGGLVGRNEPL